MGYSISVEKSSFRIRRENFPAALNAVKNLSSPEILDAHGSGGSYSSAGRTVHYAWVRMDTFTRAQTLKDALEAWRWELEVEEVENGEAGDAVGIHFLGEKLGDDQILFSTLAPFVEDGSYMDFHGEDGAHWRWLFRSGDIVEQWGEVVYS